jgi:hypothetical protein
MKLGIAVSVYDKFEELRILLDILNSFESVHQVVVIRNDKASNDDYIKFEIDENCTKVLENDKFKFLNDSSLKNESITARIWESQRQGLLELSENNDYVIHTHSDGWVLNEFELLNIVDLIFKANKIMAFRGPGLSYRNSKGEILGKLDDHFYILKGSFLKNSSFIRRSPLSLPLDLLNIHGILAFWIHAEISFEKTIHYEDFTEVFDWEGKIINYSKTNAPMLRPLHFSDRYMLLHIHRSDFDFNFGKNFQAYYLKKYLSKKSIFINTFIKENFVPIEKLRSNQKSMIGKKRLFISLLGFNMAIHKNNPFLINSISNKIFQNPFFLLTHIIKILLYPSTRFFNRNSCYPKKFVDIMHNLEIKIKS